MLDIHGEYSSALADVATVFSVDPQQGEEKLHIPYWALNSDDLLGFLTAGVSGPQETAFTDEIFALKVSSHERADYPGIEESSITVDTPVPFSLKQLWCNLVDFELTTFEGPDREQPTLQASGNADELRCEVS